MRRLASVDELSSETFRSFVSWLNAFARTHGLRVHTNWSKVWEYPWAWHQLSKLPFPGLKILDIGSEISPMPWFFASLGAEVRMIETVPSHVRQWQHVKEAGGFKVEWTLVSGPVLPISDDTFDAVTSFSVIEHIVDKKTALDEAVRVLKPGGILCLTFDICEPSRGMTFPEWSGTALDLETFERLFWRHEGLEPLDALAQWNIDDMEPFRQWNLQSAPYHNYVVGGAILLKKRRPPPLPLAEEKRPFRVHQIDTGLGSGNTGDDAMFLAALGDLSPEFDLTTEVHSLERTEVLPQGVKYVHVQDTRSIERSILEAELCLLVGDTPVMEAWGLVWPLQANAGKLRLCHRLSKPVHAVGVGVDRLRDPEALQIFEELYSPIASWSVRSRQCKSALEEMGVPAGRIIVGADWAWRLYPRIDREWAAGWLRESGARPNKVNVGVNLVNEIWKDDVKLKDAWAAVLDGVIAAHDAQLFFFCNESRAGTFFDRAAAEEVRRRMRHPSVLVTPKYYQPSEMISLLSLMHATISLRYHFTLFSVLADVYPISIQRGQKMEALNRELHLPDLGSMSRIDQSGIEREIASALSDPEAKLRSLRLCRSQLEERAGNNLALVRYSLHSSATGIPTG